MFSLNTGDTGFVMLCTALVCMMTPALALFYGGMVRKKNVLTIMMQNFISMGVTAVIWIFGGFSLAFGDRKSTRLNSSHEIPSRMPSSA